MKRDNEPIPLEMIFPEEYGRPISPESGDPVREYKSRDYPDGFFGRYHYPDFWFFINPFIR